MEMYKKTAIRRLFKTMRNSPRMRTLIEADNESFDWDKNEEAEPRRTRTTAKVKLLSGATEALPPPAEEPAEGEVVAEPEPVFA